MYFYRFQTIRTFSGLYFSNIFTAPVLPSISGSRSPVSVYQRAPTVGLQAGPAERGHPGRVCGRRAGVQQHGGRPQGEWPSHWLGENAIHQLPATNVTISPELRVLLVQKTYGTDLKLVIKMFPFKIAILIQAALLSNSFGQFLVEN